MTNEKLGSTRQGCVSPQVGEWVKGIADEHGDANYEIVDITDFENFSTFKPAEVHDKM